MPNRGWRSLTGVGLVVLLALLACKKSESTAAPSATAAASAAAPTTVAPETSAGTATAEAADAAAEEPKAEADKPATTVGTKPVVAKTDAGAPAGDAGAPVATGSAAEAKQIERCCGALNAEAKKPGMNANKYKSAAAVCSGIAQNVKSGKANASSARTLIRAQLQGVPVPGGC